MGDRRVECPFCGELIAAGASKCRYCREWLDDAPTHPASPSGAPAETLPKQETAEAAVDKEPLANEATDPLEAAAEEEPLANGAADALPITAANLPELNAAAREPAEVNAAGSALLTVLFGLYVIYAAVEGADVLGYGVAVLAITGVVVTLAGAALFSRRWAWSPLVAVLVLVPACLIWLCYRLAFCSIDVSESNLATSLSAVLTGAPFYVAWKVFRSRHALRQQQVTPLGEAKEAVKRTVKYLKEARFDTAENVIEFEERAGVLYPQYRAALLGDVFAVIDASDDPPERLEFLTRDSVRFEFRRPGEEKRGYADMWGYMGGCRRKIRIPQGSLARYEAWKSEAERNVGESDLPP